MTLPPDLENLKNEALHISCEAWAERQGWPLARGIDRAGPCPNCGGTDRFAIHTKKNTFLCRRCGITGSGVIDLVMKTESVGFVRACEIVTGRTADTKIDPEKARRMAEEVRRAEERRRREQARYRERARKLGHQIWQDAVPLTEVPEAMDYLALRGLDPELMARDCGRYLRASASLGYLHKLTDARTGKSRWMTLCAGPALLAAVCRPDGRFGAVHQTWIDLRQPKGRLSLDPIDGRALPSRKVLGAKKGNFVPLYTPDAPRFLVMGEGLETTATAFCHARQPHTAYWAGVDLGNMVGKAARDANGKRVHDQPDMDDTEAFVPPAWCEKWTLLGEVADPGAHLMDQLARGLRRGMRRVEGMAGTIVPPPEGEAGTDINDLAMALSRAGAVSERGQDLTMRHGGGL